MIISKMAALLLDQNNGTANLRLPQRGTTPFGFAFHIMHAKKTDCKIPNFVLTSVAFFVAAVGGNRTDNVFCGSSSPS